jgi:hypothetical protein
MQQHQPQLGPSQKWLLEHGHAFVHRPTIVSVGYTTPARGNQYNEQFGYGKCDSVLCDQEPDVFGYPYFFTATPTPINCEPYCQCNTTTQSNTNCIQVCCRQLVVQGWKLRQAVYQGQVDCHMTLV